MLRINGSTVGLTNTKRIKSWVHDKSDISQLTFFWDVGLAWFLKAKIFDPKITFCFKDV